MSKKMRSFNAIIIAAMLLIVTVAAAPLSAYAAVGGYTATLWYYDDVQITYSLNYPTGGVWYGAGDIPMGGVSISGSSGSYASSQIYCIDPFVAFHSLTVSDWDYSMAATKDIMEGYAVAPPWALSGAVQLNYDAVCWIIANGYRGDYLSAGDSVGNTSVDRLNSMYPGLGNIKISKQIAFMATKVAIWKVIAGDSVTIVRTSLKTADEQSLFDKLVDKLVADAKKGVYNFEKPTGLNIQVVADNPILKVGDDQISTGGVDNTGFDFYGPFYVTAALDNSSGDISGYLENVFLEVNGPVINDIYFTGDFGGQPLQDDTLYGTGDNRQYLSKDDFVNNAGVYTSAPFYLRIPDARSTTYNYKDQLTIKAMAKASNAPLSGATTLMFVHEVDGVQNWDAVQAYAGAAYGSGDLFAEARYNTGNASLGSVYISKDISNASTLDNDTAFKFKLYHKIESSDFATATPVDLSDYIVSGAVSVDPVNGSFTLKNGGTAVIDGLPDVGWYWVAEDSAGAAFAEYDEPAVYINGSAESHDNIGSLYVSDAFNINVGSVNHPTASVTFTNNKTPKHTAKLNVGKVAKEYFSEGNSLKIIESKDKQFKFELESSSNGVDGWTKVPLSDANFKSDLAGSLNATENSFMLGSFDMAEITLDAELYYRITEYNADTGVTDQPLFMVVYALERSLYQGNKYWISDIDSTNFDFDDWNPYAPQHTTKSFKAQENSYYYVLYENLIIEYSNLTVSKTVVGKPEADGGGGAPDERFYFLIEYMDPIGELLPPIAAYGSTTAGWGWGKISGIGEEQVGKPDSGDRYTFWLTDGQSATMEGLPGAHYRVTEIPNDAYNTTYTINSDSAKIADNGQTERFLMTMNTEVAFTNTVISDSRSETPDNKEEKPTGSNGHGWRPGTAGSIEPERPGTVDQTDTADEGGSEDTGDIQTDTLITDRSANRRGANQNGAIDAEQQDEEFYGFDEWGNPLDAPNVSRADEEEAAAAQAVDVIEVSAPVKQARAPQTGDSHRGQTANVAMLAAGMVCIAGALIYQIRRRRKAS